LDDFLYISTKQKQTQEFVIIINTGFPDFGCFVNPAKTCLNFEPKWTDKSIQYTTTKVFIWCGLIVGNDLSINPALPSANGNLLKRLSIFLTY
jgi:hypothetical protein